MTLRGSAVGRLLVVFVVVGALALAAVVRLGGSRPLPHGPNIVLILTDDQTIESLPHDQPVMPILQSMIDDPHDHWVAFPNAFVNTPLCCPSRATILTGRYSHHTGVRDNREGERLDDSSTVATWLHDAGYTTALVGKYLNGYPFGGPPVAPPGWDRWAGKIQGGATSVYADYAISDQGVVRRFGAAPVDYSTDVFAALATDFLRSASGDRPFFLMFTPTAPHEPWTPPPRYDGVYASMSIPTPPSVDDPDVSDAPAWVRDRPMPDQEQVDAWREDRRRAYEALRGVDDAVGKVVDTLRRLDELDDTVIVFMTDNGFAFGEHRWFAKSCPYDECIRTPFFVRYPGATAHVDDHLVSNVDVAPTLAQLAGVRPGSAVDGRSLVPLLDGLPTSTWRAGVLCGFEGDADVPAWWELRTRRYAYVEYATGERELYDLRSDPWELSNLARSRRTSALRARLSATLASLRAAP